MKVVVTHDSSQDQLSQTYNLIVWIIDIDIVASTEAQLLQAN